MTKVSKKTTSKKEPCEDFFQLFPEEKGKNKSFPILLERLQKLAKEKNLSPEQISSLLNSHPEMEQDDEIKTFINILQKNWSEFRKMFEPARRHKFRQSGHFVDQKLKHSFPVNKQPSLFDLVQDSKLKNRIESGQIELQALGVRLSSPEDRLLNALQGLLHKNSLNTDPEANEYYKGNERNSLVTFGKDKKESPTLRIKPADLYKAYLERDEYSGAEIKYIKNLLINLANKKFLMIFDRKRKEKVKGKIETLTDRIEEYQGLIRVISYTEGLSEKEMKNLKKGDNSAFEKKGELIIGFNPILVDQISSKYVEYPSDINKRMAIAAGGGRLVTEAMNLLRDYLLRSISCKNYRVEINEDRLPFVLKLDSCVKFHRKKRLKDRIDGAIQTCKNLGLLLNAEIITGSLGQNKYVFELNPNFITEPGPTDP